MKKVLMLACFVALLTGCAVAPAQPVVHIPTEQEELQQAQARDLARQQTRKSYVQAHPELSQSVKNAILGGQLIIGMSVDAVLVSQNQEREEYDIHRTVSAYGVHEQWVWRRHEFYIYFDNGVLTSWQD